MLESQQTARTASSFVAPQAEEGASQWQFDDDLAIGCECANPALQIERWGQEDAGQPRQLA